ncbi:Uncharacterised protein [Mycobacteroides abscessus subsp. abscessus]|uniref:hypothetical protein n=1 Tax=Mycobacteroides abscessus TaxID=36809 RepID=UPI000450FEF8|nr:hypothetical protein [Mycobacteroides abscessus]QSM02219.1 immunity repressor [Mycobacterium phage prophiGD24-3]QSM04354.1 immunity repressor [Mycobacterium phage prophiGD43A-4]WJJ55746.1 immunity repressor [Mycobacterium phage prophiT46-3]EUA84262.1 repressor-like immunity protein [Mycobacteroides abscessus]MBN7403225.1 hypothetical protein [Mycobacteroides abscessus subsp. abscessus]
MDETYASGLTIGIIRQLKNEGYNHSQIAEMFGVTRQAVSYLWRKYDGTPTIRQRVAEALPFAVPEKFNRAQPLALLRDHAEHMMQGSDRFTERRRSKLRSFYKKLRDENLVVEYDPEIPSDPGVCKPGGFAYRPREPRDKGLMIRVNEHTHITEYGEQIWKFPPREP